MRASIILVATIALALPQLSAQNQFVPYGTPPRPVAPPLEYVPVTAVPEESYVQQERVPFETAADYLSSPNGNVDVTQTSNQMNVPYYEDTCGESCGHCGGGGCCICCVPYWAHKTSIFGEYLFMSAKQQHLDFATPVDGTTNTAVPVGRTAVFAPEYSHGFRAGGTLRVDECSSFMFQWTNFQSDVFKQVRLPGGAPAPNAFLRSELVHPNTVDVGNDSLTASGNYSLDFRTADAAFTKTLTGDCDQRLNGTFGFRYGNLVQDLRSQHRILDNVMVDTDIDFDGYGPRFALDYERIACGGFLFYAKGGISLLAGRFDATYLQSSVFSGVEAASGILEDRIVPQYELEIGSGWESPGGAFRVTAGYIYNIWGNVLTTPGFIDGVQAEELDNIDETLTFDGLAVRAQVLF